MSTTAEIERLRHVALRQPGAKERANGVIKFQCPQCRDDGHDAHQDNAALFLRDGTWGCAFASKGAPDGRRHWEAIGRTIGAGLSTLHHEDPAPTDAPTTSQLTILGAGAFIAQMFTEPDPLIESILSDDSGGWLGGEEKTGKTWWMEAEALALALAKPLAGRFAVTRRHRALILEEEDSPRRTHRRLRAVLRGYDVDPDDPDVQRDLDALLRISVWSGFTLDNASSSPSWMRRSEPSGLRSSTSTVCGRSP
jgi:AAA domain